MIGVVVAWVPSGSRPSAPPATQGASANSLAWEMSSILPSPRFAARCGSIVSVNPPKQTYAMKVTMMVTCG